MLICDLCKKPVTDNNVSVLRNILKEYAPSKDFCFECLDLIDNVIDGKVKIIKEVTTDESKSNSNSN